MSEAYDLGRLKLISRVGGMLAVAGAVVLVAFAVLMLCGLVISVLDPDALGTTVDFVVQVNGEESEVSSADAPGLFAAGFLVSAVLSATLWILGGILGSIGREYTPFTERNARGFRGMSAAFLALILVSVVAYLFGPDLFPNVLLLVAVFFMAAVGTYAMSLVFRYGAALQRESDETL